MGNPGIAQCAPHRTDVIRLGQSRLALQCGDGFAVGGNARGKFCTRLALPHVVGFFLLQLGRDVGDIGAGIGGELLQTGFLFQQVFQRFQLAVEVAQALFQRRFFLFQRRLVLMCRAQGGTPLRHLGALAG